MTDVGKLPDEVVANIVTRERAAERKLVCWVCGEPGRLYPGPAACDAHSPWALAGRPRPGRTAYGTQHREALLAARDRTPQAVEDAA